MTTFRQFVRDKKKLAKSSHKNYNRSPKLEGCPQRRGILVRIYTTVPKKPNSSIRKIVKLRLSTGEYIRAAVSGQGHVLQEHSTVLVKANRVRDIPGMHYRLIRGAFDFIPTERRERLTSRSKYGIKFDKDPRIEVSKKSLEILGPKLSPAHLQSLLDINKKLEQNRK